MSPGLNSLIRKVNREFKNRFGPDPLIVRSPGRINLLGEHTDYNDGFVLPAAIDKVVVLAMAPNDLNRVRLYGIDMKMPEFETEVTGKFEKTDRHWPNYILGVINQLIARGASVSGFDCVIGGNIPVGAGLSSSAALVGGVVYGFSTLFHLDPDRLEMAQIGQRTENEFVGVQCGIMDHFANMFGQTGQVIKLDCRNLTHVLFPFTADSLKIVLFDTGVRRELASTGYNERRLQCEEGVAYLKRFEPGINKLRDVPSELLETHRGHLNQNVYRRCRYILDENIRVESACNALRDGDFEQFGQRMYESHYGLRDQYDVSCHELDILVSATEDLDGVLGARMMGGGFGGCTINLMKRDGLEQHVSHISERYRQQTGANPDVHMVEIADGTGLVSLNNAERAHE